MSWGFRVSAECSVCGKALDETVPGWCPSCGHHERVPARTLLWWLIDGPAFPQFSSHRPDPLHWPGYAAARQSAEAATDQDESVVVARGRVKDSRVEAVFVAWEFGFLGGSMSSEAGARIAAAFDVARSHHIPIVLLPSTGGARMQEGMASLVQMATTTVAARQHAKDGLLQVTILRDPTTGGVFASHANLTDVVLAEPGATIGFAGPRVAAAMTGGPLPEGSHTSEGARAAGLVDAVIGRPKLPAALTTILSWPDGRLKRPIPSVPSTLPGPTEDAWQEVQRARAPDRARTPDYLGAMDGGFELRGDRAGGDDPALRAVMAKVHGRPVMVLGLDRTRNEGRITPAGYRKAWRALRIADRLGIPVLTLVDTPGADASAASEAGGIANHIARTFAAMLATRSPIVSLVIGEGGSGGALSLTVGDRVLIQEHAVFSVIAPEGAAAILYRDAERAPDVAKLLRPTAHSLWELNLADEIVGEPEGHEVEAALATVARHLDELGDQAWPARQAHRRERWRQAGTPR